jgi:DNA helicase-2/ATP-dependent DNA helicase PcrA
MPIQLNDLTKTPKVSTYSPKFFDSKLTGVGKKIGILNEAKNPAHIDKNQRTSGENITCTKHKYSNGNATVMFIPFYIISYDAWGYIKSLDVPEDARTIGTIDDHGTTLNVKLSMDVHTAILEEIAPQYKNGPSTKTLTVCYQPFIWLENPNTPHCDNLYQVISALRQNVGGFCTDFSCNPMHWFSSNLSDLMQRYTHNTIDMAKAVDFIADYDLYSGIVKRSEQWQTTIDKTLDTLFAQAVMGFAHDKGMLNTISSILHAIEAYDVPLDLYRNIYTSIQKHFSADEATILCKQNLSLLLSDTLHNLDTNKANLNHVPVPQTPVAIDPRYSTEQKKAITTDEPLVLVQAGAGTGKSTVILARIDYMVKAGVDPKDITVLSFTNAAADHISEKNPNVHSMTIAKMIHTIYTENFKNHELSSIDTIINSLDIYFPNNDFAYTFRNKLRAIAKNDRDAFTRMNNFVERHYDEVMKVLDTIGQTSLELEIIICYQRINFLTEPAEVQSKHLIIDEVQDTSVFEFIYAIKYIDKHNESMFMVGDASQSLYEFRSANPKALNVLEGSGVFATYSLQTNYRSNQEILDFANVVLSDIEVNQYAHIQLQANSLTPVTEQSFCDKVWLHYERLNKLSDFNDTMHSLFATKVSAFIDKKLAAGEQVAFLAYTRNHVYRMQEILTKLYPNRTIVNLVPEKMYNSTIFSEFIKCYWNEVQFIPSKSIILVIGQEIINRLGRLVYDKNKSLTQTQKMIQQWYMDANNTIKAWQSQLAANLITQDEFLENVKQNMLQFEIRRNAVRQSLLSARNAAEKENNAAANADFVLSTIHSAKGLEFQNTVVIYRADNDMDEEAKRMYYVALTRAMHSEYILAFDKVASPKIEGDYKAIVEQLHNKAKNAIGQHANP